MAEPGQGQADDGDRGPAERRLTCGSRCFAAMTRSGAGGAGGGSRWSSEGRREMTGALAGLLIGAFVTGPSRLPAESIMELFDRAIRGSQAAKALLISLAQTEIELGNPGARSFILDGASVNLPELLKGGDDG